MQQGIKSSRCILQHGEVTSFCILQWGIRSYRNKMQRGVKSYRCKMQWGGKGKISGNISPLHDAAGRFHSPLHDTAGSQILPPYHAAGIQFGSGESIWQREVYFGSGESSLKTWEVSWVLKGTIMSKITYGETSLSYSYENHVLKLSQLTDFFTPPCMMQRRVKLRIQLTPRLWSKKRKILGYESEAQTVISDGKKNRRILPQLSLYTIEL